MSVWDVGRWHVEGYVSKMSQKGREESALPLQYYSLLSSDESKWVYGIWCGHRKTCLRESKMSVFWGLSVGEGETRWSLCVLLRPSRGKGSICESLIILFSFFLLLLFFNKSLRTICFSLVVCFPRVQPLFEILEQQSCSKYGQPTCNYAGMSTLPLRVGPPLVNQRPPQTQKWDLLQDPVEGRPRALHLKGVSEPIIMLTV